MVKKPMTKLITSEEAAIGSVSWGVYLRYFRSVGITFIVIVIVFNMISQGSAVIQSFKSLKFQL